MIIAFKKNVDGVLLACSALEKHLNANLVFAKDKGELEKKLSFLDAEEEVLVLGFKPTGSTAGIVKEILGKRPTKMSPRDPKPVQYVDLVLRHRDANPAELVKLLVSCKGCAEMLYSGKSILSRRYYRYMRDVTRAWQRLCMFSRPDFSNGILTVKIYSPHEIEDIFCRWLAKKNHDVPVAVIQGTVAWLGNGEMVGVEHFIKTEASFVSSLRVSAQKDDEVEKLWDVFYNSQMIENRRNRGLAKKMQPKSSALLSKMAKKDRYMVERGIPSCTLDSFV